MSDLPPVRPSRAQAATLACLLEATVPKPGNVHRGADFADLTFGDFAVSAAAIAPAIESAAEIGVGAAVLLAIESTRQWVQTNTNLGIVLLLAPLSAAAGAAACGEEPGSSVGPVSRSGMIGLRLPAVLAGLTAEDARAVYQAIRVATPAGMGTVKEHDVHGHPPASLLEAMRAAADRDLVARQYGNSFAEVLGPISSDLRMGSQSGWRMTENIIYAQVNTIAAFGDSLVARKCGADTAGELKDRAGEVLKLWPRTETGPAPELPLQPLADFDFWLRADGHRRNPGTTADLLAAALFVGIWEGWLPPPWPL